MNIAASLFSLVKYNNGFFKSNKQAAFLGSKFDGDFYISVSNLHFGEWESRTSRNTAQVVYTFRKDAKGVVEVTKQTSKGVHVYWVRKSEDEFNLQSVQRAKKAALCKRLNVIRDRVQQLIKTKDDLVNLVAATAELSEKDIKCAKLFSKVKRHIDKLDQRWFEVEKQYTSIKVIK